MVAVGFAVLWGAYTLGIWGYCLVRGYDVPFSGIFGGTWPGGGQQAPANNSAGGTPGAPGGSGAPVILT